MHRLPWQQLLCSTRNRNKRHIVLHKQHFDIFFISISRGVKQLITLIAIDYSFLLETCIKANVYISHRLSHVHWRRKIGITLNFPTYGNVGYIFSWPDSQVPAEESQSPQMISFYSLLVIILKPARVCKCWTLARLRLEVLQAPGTAVRPHLCRLTWEGCCVLQPLSTWRAKLQNWLKIPQACSKWTEESSTFLFP